MVTESHAGVGPEGQRTQAGGAYTESLSATMLLLVALVVRLAELGDWTKRQSQSLEQGPWVAQTNVTSRTRKAASTCGPRCPRKRALDAACNMS